MEGFETKMTPQLLTVKIQAILGGRSNASDMQKRSVATEYYKLCAQTESQLEHCVALIKAGRDYTALQVAESSDLLDTLNALLFPEIEQWRAFCDGANLPVPPPFDDAQIELVNSLYSRGISQNHPLYRDFRRAMRMRRYEDALAVIKTISKINAYDAEARRECEKLSRRVASAKLAQLERAVAADDFAEASKIRDALAPEAATLSDNKIWRNAELYLRSHTEEAERKRCAEIVAELEKLDVERDFAAAADLVNEFNLLRGDADFDGTEFVERISAETAKKQDAAIAAAKAARAANLARAELEKPDKSEKRAERLARLTALKAEAADALDAEAAKRLSSEISKLRAAAVLAKLALAAAVCAGIAAVGAGAYFAWSYETARQNEIAAENEIAEMENLREPSHLPKKIAEFERKYPSKKYAERLAALADSAKIAANRLARVKEAVRSLEKFDPKTAKPADFEKAKNLVEELRLEAASLSPVEQSVYRGIIDSSGKRISAAAEERRAKNAADLRKYLAQYEAVAEEYENFARAKADIDRDADAVLEKLRPLVGEVSATFRPHRLDSEKFDEISVRVADAKNAYAKFDKLRSALLTSQSAAEYAASLESLAESGAAPAEFSRKLSKIAEVKDAILRGQTAEFGTPEAAARLDSAGIAAKASLPENEMLTNLYKYSREGRLDVYTLGKISEKTSKWRGGSEVVQEVREVGAGGKILTSPYRKHFIDGRAPRGVLLVGGAKTAESMLAEKAAQTASKQSLLSALSLVGNARTNPIFRAYLEKLIFAKLAENPVETLLEYSPKARTRMAALERYAKPLEAHSWIFESNSKTRLVGSELYGSPAPDYFDDARTHVNALKIALENPLELVGVCDENGKPSIFREAAGAVWSVDAKTGKFGKLGRGKPAPLAPIFRERKSAAEIMREASQKGAGENNG